MALASKPSQFYATVSTAIVLVMLTLFLLLFSHSTHITNLAKESLSILVELDDNVFEDQQKELSRMISNIDGVKSPSVEILSKETAKETMEQELSVLDSTYGNPLKTVISFNLESDAYNEQNLKVVKSKIELEKGVIGVYYENENVEIMKANLQKLSFGILVIALSFVILAVAIIFNTIRLTLYSDLKEIKTMQMVGAENTFIKKPYLKNAFFIAIKATIIMLFAVLGIYTYSKFANNAIHQILDVKLVILTVLISSLVAMVLQMSTTNFIINRFLKNNLA